MAIHGLLGARDYMLPVHLVREKYVTHLPPLPPPLLLPLLLLPPPLPPPKDLVNQLEI